MHRELCDVPAGALEQARLLQEDDFGTTSPIVIIVDVEEARHAA
jgi:hypothetical protein